MYYTTATVDVASAGALNDALANVTTTPTTVNLTEVITVQEGHAIEIPYDAENVTLNFEAAPVTTEDTPLVINQNDEATSGDATSELNIKMPAMPADAEGLHATINAPTTTVTLVGGIYESIEATTATNTLIIGEGVTIKKLVVKGGNVVLKGSVKNIESDVETTITLDKNITLAESIVFSKGDVTVNLNGKEIKCESSDVFVVTAGTLTINGIGLVYGSEGNSSSSCAVWAKETGSVIINGGTYKVGHDGASKTAGSKNWRNDCIYARDKAHITINGGEFAYTGDINTENFESDGNRFLLNCRNDDYKAGTCSITVTGGTFHNFNPAATASENPVANYVAAGYSSVAGENGTYVVKKGILNETALKAAIAAGKTEVTLGEDITLTDAITIPTGITATINLNGFDVTAPNTDVFEVAGTLTIKDTNNEGVVSAGTGHPNASVCAVWANGGNVTIDGGHYIAYSDAAGKRNDCIYAGYNADNNDTAGNITINGGKFEYVWPDSKNSGIEYDGDMYLLNCADKDLYQTLITVNGGQFKNNAPSYEPTTPAGRTSSEVQLGTNKKVYNGETEVTAAHSGTTDIWYVVK